MTLVFVGLLYKTNYMRLLLFILLSISGSVSAQSYYLFIGTYTNSDSKGVYVYRFNAATGKAEAVSNTENADVASPSYLAISPNKKFVYAVNETGGAKPGTVSAFSFDQKTGKLTFINKQPSGGDGPCYITVSKNDKWALVANYSGGSLAALPIDANGALKPFSQLIQHSGKGADAQRQEKPHVHSTILSPQQDYLFSADLGLDKVFTYAFKPSANQPLEDAQPPFTETVAKAGPRHFTFHPNERFAYLIEELSGTVIAYSYNKGKLTQLQSILAHPADFKGNLGSADIHVSPDGKFLYASNRGDENTLAIFSVDSKTGKLESRGYQLTLGKAPRNFIIDPTGNYLLVANQQTNNIVIFKRNKETGLLQEAGEQINVPLPVCLQLMRQ
jgi:6-phosphogluconolactonase